jgi:nucleoside-diphosphate-sugar epimerase
VKAAKLRVGLKLQSEVAACIKPLNRTRNLKGANPVAEQLYLVTGGAGFIGSHIAEALVRRGERVRVLDNLMTGRRENLAHLADKIEFVEGDIRDAEATRRAAEGVGIVFHEAAIPSVPRSVADPRLSHEVNVNGTFNVLMAAREAGVRRVVYAASSSAYGDTETLPKHEGMLPAPLSPYAAAKLFGEYYCQVFTRVYGLETVALRYFNVFGPRQDPSSPYSGVISKFVTSLLAGEAPVIYGDGEQSRDFTYVDNVVDANLRAAHAPEAAGAVINTAIGERITLNALLAELQQIIGTNLKPQYAEKRAGDVRHSLADIGEAQKRLGYEPLVSLREGLRRTVEWYRESVG